MSQRPRYTDEFRASVVLMLEAAGYPDRKGALTAVSKNVKVPHPTCSRWYRQVNNPPPNELVQDKKIDIVFELQQLLGLHISEANKTVKDADHHQVIGGIKIIVDAIQLLTGGPTSNENLRIEYVNDWRTAKN